MHACAVLDAGHGTDSPIFSGVPRSIGHRVVNRMTLLYLFSHQSQCSDKIKIKYVEELQIEISCTFCRSMFLYTPPADLACTVFALLPPFADDRNSSGRLPLVPVCASSIYRHYLGSGVTNGNRMAIESYYISSRFHAHYRGQWHYSTGTIWEPRHCMLQHMVVRYDVLMCPTLHCSG